MFINGKVTLYLKSLGYKKVTYDCAKFDSKSNTFTNEGNYVDDVIKIYIPLSKMGDEDIQINANIDYLMIGECDINAEVNERGELINTSKLLEAGAKSITKSSKKKYGSSYMQHYYIEV